LKEQKEQKEEEESMLKAHHASQVEKLKAATEEQVSIKVSEHENEKIELSSKNKETIDKLESSYWNAFLDFTRSQNKQYREFAVLNHEQEINLAKNCLDEHTKLHQSFKEEVKSLTAPEVVPSQIDDFIIGLEACEKELLEIESQKIDSLALVHEEELNDLDDLHTREEKAVLNKAPPGIFAS